MTNSGSAPKKTGWMASLQAALAPLPPEEDDGGQLVAPRGVIVATVLAILGGLAFLWPSLGTLLTLNSQIDSVREKYVQQVAECQAVGGIGTAVTAHPAAGQESLAANCKNYRVLTDADWSGLHTQLVIISVIFLVMAVAAIVTGWFLRSGATWCRRVVIAVVILAVVGSLLLRISNTVTLIGTVALLITLVLCYVGKGGLFFAMTAQRRRQG